MKKLRDFINEFSRLCWGFSEQELKKKNNQELDEFDELNDESSLNSSSFSEETPIIEDMNDSIDAIYDINSKNNSDLRLLAFENLKKEYENISFMKKFIYYCQKQWLPLMDNMLNYSAINQITRSNSVIESYHYILQQQLRKKPTLNEVIDVLRREEKENFDKILSYEKNGKKNKDFIDLSLIEKIKNNNNSTRLNNQENNSKKRKLVLEEQKKLQ